MKLTTMLLALCALLFVPISVSAQGGPFHRAGPDDRRIPLTVLLVDDDFPPSVLRRVREPRNMLIVDARTVTEQSLSDAITAFLLQEREDPSGAERSDRALSRSTFGASAPPYAWATEAVRRLRAAARQRVSGIPREGRVLQLWVHPLAVRERGAGRG